ncbi:ATP-binding cassette domain-containing protein [Ectothiorhodospiraceae bacterium WFHF3C12]|nr:ATP-binding cassette domain-containing protein [Ectothiorhodospiraceae bacterium WFHF3C12]
MPSAIRVIQSEHNGIWRILNTAEELAAEYERAARPPDAELFGAIFEYIESYADRVHHPKEDQYLFRFLRLRSPESAEVLDELERQHDEGPGLVEAARKSLDQCVEHYPQGCEAFRDDLARYIEFQREHLKREERDVIPKAREVLTEADWAEIDAAFARNDDPLFGEQVQAEFRALHSRIANLAPEPLGLGLSARESAAAEPAAEAAPALLEVRGLTSHYGRIQALKGIDVSVPAGHLVALVGANGAGKSTLLKTISGIHPSSGGSIHFDGREITALPGERRVAQGIAQVPEGRQVFGPMSVEDNLVLGAFTRGRNAETRADLERMYDLFPILREKRRQAAGTLSGGQQQMLAIGRALMAKPKVLLLDEPSMGLAPLLVAEIFNVIRRLKEEGITVLLVEQNAAGALGLADHGYVIETGEIVLSGPGPELLEDEEVKRAYLGM